MLPLGPRALDKWGPRPQWHRAVALVILILWSAIHLAPLALGKSIARDVVVYGDGAVIVVATVMIVLRTLLHIRRLRYYVAHQGWKKPCKTHKHLIVVPIYMEPVEVVAQTLGTINALQRRKNLTVVLGLEARSPFLQEQRDLARLCPDVAEVRVFEHTLTKEEKPCSGSNVASALRAWHEAMVAEGRDAGEYFATKFDAQIEVHQQYLVDLDQHIDAWEAKGKGPVVWSVPIGHLLGTRESPLFCDIFVSFIYIFCTGLPGVTCFSAYSMPFAQYAAIGFNHVQYNGEDTMVVRTTLPVLKTPIRGHWCSAARALNKQQKRWFGGFAEISGFAAVHGRGGYGLLFTWFAYSWAQMTLYFLALGQQPEYARFASVVTPFSYFLTPGFILLMWRVEAAQEYAFREHLAAKSFHVPCYEHMLRLIIYPVQSFFETLARYIFYLRVMLCGTIKYVPSTKTASASYTRAKRISEAKIAAAEDVAKQIQAEMMAAAGGKVTPDVEGGL